MNSYFIAFNSIIFQSNKSNFFLLSCRWIINELSDVRAQIQQKRGRDREDFYWKQSHPKFNLYAEGGRNEQLTDHHRQSHFFAAAQTSKVLLSKESLFWKSATSLVIHTFTTHVAAVVENTFVNKSFRISFSNQGEVYG